MVCSRSHLEKSQYFQEIIAKSLNVWHKYIPEQYNMDSSNCWFVDFGRQPLANDLQHKMENTREFADLQDTFTNGEIKAMLKSGYTIKESRRSAHYFCLPKTYLIGFPKCGTSLLYTYFKSHPLFAEPRFKEGQFWREYFRVGDDEHKQVQVLVYLFRYFSTSQSIRRYSKLFTIDASASTVFSSSRPFVKPEYDMCALPVTLFETLPRSKIIIIMRNPTDRLWSDFWYFCARVRGESKSKFMDNLHQAPAVFHNYTVLAIQDFNQCISDHDIFHCTMLAGTVAGGDVACDDIRLGIGVYYVHVKRWLNVFPRDQVLTVRLEDLTSDPMRVMNGVWAFLRLSDKHDVKPITEKVNSLDTGKDIAMWPETKKLIENFFNPYNNMLAKLLDDHRYLWK